MRFKTGILVPVLAGLLALTGAGQDMVQLTDGRFVIGPPMTKKPDGVVVHYENGDVLIPKSLVKESSTSKREGLQEEVRSAADQKKIDQGFVRFEGKWTKKSALEKTVNLLKKRRKKRIEAAMKRRKWRSRGKRKTKNFAFEFTIDPDKMDEYADLMENYFKTFTKAWGIRKPRDIKRLKVCFYHDREYFQQVSGASRGVLGYFRFVPPEELHFYYDRMDERMTIDVMYHETNHFLTHLIDTKFVYPPWVNESLAEYYGASKWDPDDKKMSIGHLQEGRLTVIQDQITADDWQGLEQLIRLEHGAFNAIHYAWGWSFVHFLLESPEYSKRFKKFYIGLARDKTIERKPYAFGMTTVEADEQIEALKRYLKIDDLTALEREWHGYIKKLKQTSPRGFAEAGELFLARGMPIKARRFFETAIEKGNDNPNTYYGLGRACARKGKHKEAEKAFRKGLELDPLNGMFYVQLARALANQSRSKDDEEAKRLRKLALEVDPDNYRVIQEVAGEEFALER